MGVTGLLPVLSAAQEQITLEKYRGKTLAIDTYGWLHRLIMLCAEDLCTNQPTRRYVNLIIKKIEMMRYFGVEPYFVFDGALLPTKAETNRERRRRREDAQRKADNYAQLGNSKAAWKEYSKAASVTHNMAKSVMVELDQMGISYVVAPYEADPQMVYLEKQGIVDGIILEDSDLLVFGATVLITKLKDNGTCIEVDRNRSVQLVPQLKGFGDEQWRYLAMILGCDYTKGIEKVGMVTALKFINKYRDLNSLIRGLRAEGKSVPQEFLDEVKLADLAFQFQKVYDPVDRQLKTLNPYPSNFNLGELELTLEQCCGQTRTNLHYQQACTGRIDPNTWEPLLTREQSLVALRSKSMSTKLPPSKLVLDFFQLAKKSTLVVTPKLSTATLPTSRRLKRMLGESKPLALSPFFNKQDHSQSNGAGISNVTQSSSIKSPSGLIVIADDPTDDDEVPDSPIRAKKMVSEPSVVASITDMCLEYAQLELDTGISLVSPRKAVASSKALSPANVKQYSSVKNKLVMASSPIQGDVDFSDGESIPEPMLSPDKRNRLLALLRSRFLFADTVASKPMATSKLKPMPGYFGSKKPVDRPVGSAVPASSNPINPPSTRLPLSSKPITNNIVVSNKPNLADFAYKRPRVSK